jgi:uncharacterized membrane protein
MDILGLAMRWTHIAGMAFLSGGALYARFVLTPAMDGMGESEKTKLGNRMAEALRPWVMAAVLAVLGSGTVNLLRKTGLPPGYHMWFGIKVLLALHVIAVSVLLAKPNVDAGKRKRWLTGVVGSSLAIFLISAYLRAMQQ